MREWLSKFHDVIYVRPLKVCWFQGDSGGPLFAYKKRKNKTEEVQIGILVSIYNVSSSLPKSFAVSYKNKYISICKNSTTFWNWEVFLQMALVIRQHILRHKSYSTGYLQQYRIFQTMDWWEHEFLNHFSIRKKKFFKWNIQCFGKIAVFALQLILR